MFESLEQIPLQELKWRWARCRTVLQEDLPGAGGVLVFSRINIYWLSGHLANGMFWLPLEGEPVLLLRKGLERARLESLVQEQHGFRSFSDLPRVLADLGRDMPENIAVEMSGLNWSLGQNFSQKLPGLKLQNADFLLSQARMVKSQWELYKITLAGQRQAQVLEQDLPQVISSGQSEMELSHALWGQYFQQGHQGHVRMGGPGEELFLGAVSAGDSSNYPTSYNGPVGLRGVHPALPYMGYAGKVWQPGEILIVDTLFALEGYYTDKAQVYFAGSKEQIPKQMRKAQDFCAGLQDWMQDRLQPGTTPQELYEYCVQQAEKQGWSEGFMGLGGNKVPFVGHGIGLTVDEYPPLARKFQQPLEENMVLALEPKVALPEVGMIGVENTFRVTPQGGQSLTGGIRELICLE
ncbi:MAG: M24 family metallopeptidase [Desulfohalobiaceae bacterium]